MPIDDYRLYTALRGLQERVSFEEAGAIIDVARLAAIADGKTTIDEMAVVVMLRRIISELAGGNMPHPSTAIDAKRLADIGDQLVATGPRELAYACAFLVMIHDLTLTADERAMADKLADALVIDPERAKVIAADMESIARGEPAP